MSRESEERLQQALSDLKQSVTTKNLVAQLSLTLELFHCVITAPSAVTNLRNGVLDLTTCIRDNPLTLWLHVIDIGVLSKELNDILTDYENGWKGLKMLPTGCMVKTKYKKGHFTFDKIRDIKHVNLLARRFSLLMGVSSVTTKKKLYLHLQLIILS